MSIWIRTFCPRTVGALDAEVLRAGISERLKLLTYLFCPEDEEEPADVLARLRIESPVADRLQIFYRRELDRFLGVERWTGSQAAEEVSEEVERIESYKGDGAVRVRKVLGETTETVAFELKPSDAQGMGWPLAIAAAAKLAEISGGVVSADSGWMVPSGREVSFLVQA
jgi:hypothetical protein